MAFNYLFLLHHDLLYGWYTYCQNNKNKCKITMDSSFNIKTFRKTKQWNQNCQFCTRQCQTSGFLTLSKVVLKNEKNSHFYLPLGACHRINFKKNLINRAGYFLYFYTFGLKNACIP